MTSQHAGPNDGHQTISKLIARMDSDPGFASVGGSIQVISTLDDDADGDSRKITAAILQDAALTAKLLRLSNASSRGSRNVSTVDQAVSILGLNTVKSVAISLALLNSMSDKPQTKQLHAEIVAAYFCGTLSSQITRNYGARFNSQEAQVCGLMQNLGRIMALYYLYEDIESSHALQAAENLSEDDAVEKTLGVSFEMIGTAIAEHWKLPDVIGQSLAPKIDKVPPRVSPNSALGWHQLCSVFARRITDALFRLPEGKDKIEIKQNLNFFHQALLLKNDEVLEWIERALTDTNTLLAELAFPCNVEDARSLLRKASERVLDSLSSQDSLTKGHHGDAKKPIEIIHHALRMIHDEFNFDLTILCLPSGSGLVAVAGVGRNVNQVTPKFRCSGAKLDIFQLIMTKKVDMYIADVHAPTYAKLLPDWYGELIGAKSFSIFSLVHEEKFLGLLYGDYSEAHPVAPQEKTQGSVKKWRDQLLAALLVGSR